MQSKNEIIICSPFEQFLPSNPGLQSQTFGALQTPSTHPYSKQVAEKIMFTENKFYCDIPDLTYLVE